MNDLEHHEHRYFCDSQLSNSVERVLDSFTLLKTLKCFCEDVLLLRVHTSVHGEDHLQECIEVWVLTHIPQQTLLISSQLWSLMFN